MEKPSSDGSDEEEEIFVEIDSELDTDGTLCNSAAASFAEYENTAGVTSDHSEISSTAVVSGANCDTVIISSSSTTLCENEDVISVSSSVRDGALSDVEMVCASRGETPSACQRCETDHTTSPHASKSNVAADIDSRRHSEDVKLSDITTAKSVNVQKLAMYSGLKGVRIVLSRIDGLPVDSSCVKNSVTNEKEGTKLSAASVAFSTATSDMSSDGTVSSQQTLSSAKESCVLSDGASVDAPCAVTSAKEEHCVLDQLSSIAESVLDDLPVTDSCVSETANMTAVPSTDSASDSLQAGNAADTVDVELDTAAVSDRLSEDVAVDESSYHSAGLKQPHVGDLNQQKIDDSRSLLFPVVCADVSAVSQTAACPSSITSTEAMERTDESRSEYEMTCAPSDSDIMMIEAVETVEQLVTDDVIEMSMSASDDAVSSQQTLLSAESDILSDVGAPCEDKGEHRVLDQLSSIAEAVLDDLPVTDSSVSTTVNLTGIPSTDSASDILQAGNAADTVDVELDTAVVSDRLSEVVAVDESSYQGAGLKRPLAGDLGEASPLKQQKIDDSRSSLFPVVCDDVSAVSQASVENSMLTAACPSLITTSTEVMERTDESRAEYEMTCAPSDSDIMMIEAVETVEQLITDDVIDMSASDVTIGLMEKTDTDESDEDLYILTDDDALTTVTVDEMVNHRVIYVNDTVAIGDSPQFTAVSTIVTASEYQHQNVVASALTDVEDVHVSVVENVAHADDETYVYITAADANHLFVTGEVISSNAYNTEDLCIDTVKTSEVSNLESVTGKSSGISGMSRPLVLPPPPSAKNAGSKMRMKMEAANREKLLTSATVKGLQKKGRRPLTPKDVPASTSCTLQSTAVSNKDVESGTVLAVDSGLSNEKSSSSKLSDRQENQSEEQSQSTGENKIVQLPPSTTSLGIGDVLMSSNPANENVVMLSTDEKLLPTMSDQENDSQNRNELGDGLKNTMSTDWRQPPTRTSAQQPSAAAGVASLLDWKPAPGWTPKSSVVQDPQQNVMTHDQDLRPQDQDLRNQMPDSRQPPPNIVQPLMGHRPVQAPPQASSLFCPPQMTQDQDLRSQAVMAHDQDLRNSVQPLMNIPQLLPGQVPVQGNSSQPPQANTPFCPPVNVMTHDQDLRKPVLDGLPNVAQPPPVHPPPATPPLNCQAPPPLIATVTGHSRQPTPPGAVLPAASSVQPQTPPRIMPSIHQPPPNVSPQSRLGSIPPGQPLPPGIQSVPPATQPQPAVFVSQMTSSAPVQGGPSLTTVGFGSKRPLLAVAPQPVPPPQAVPSVPPSLQFIPPHRPMPPPGMGHGPPGMGHAPRMHHPPPGRGPPPPGRGPPPPGVGPPGPGMAPGPGCPPQQWGPVPPHHAAPPMWGPPPREIPPPLYNQPYPGVRNPKVHPDWRPPPMAPPGAAYMPPGVPPPNWRPPMECRPPGAGWWPPPAAGVPQWGPPQGPPDWSYAAPPEHASGFMPSNTDGDGDTESLTQAAREWAEWQQRYSEWYYTYYGCAAPSVTVPSTCSSASDPKASWSTVPTKASGRQKELPKSSASDIPLPAKQEAVVPGTAAAFAKFAEKAASNINFELGISSNRPPQNVANKSMSSSTNVSSSSVTSSQGEH